VLRILLFAVVIGALAGLVLSFLRRTPKTPADRSAEETGERRALRTPRSAHALGREATRRKLHELAFGAALAAHVPAEHVKVVSAVAGALHAVATDPKYAPRRPMLLPQLLRAVNDSDTTRRELAQLITRDPALVGSLLKLANSPLHRRGTKPIEGVERALAVLGTQGVRSLAAAALVQPVFRSMAESGPFPEVVWEYTYRAAAAAELHAAVVENAEPFAAQLLALVIGLAAIVVYRVALDVYAARRLTPDATALASLLDEHTAEVAHRIAGTWELSAPMLEALDDMRPERVTWPQSALGRSLRFGLTAGALSMLKTADRIDDDVGLVSLAAAGGEGSRFERLWERLTWPEPEPDRVPS
jgi:HD-like signal output (HDOD) protein